MSSSGSAKSTSSVSESSGSSVSGSSTSGSSVSDSSISDSSVSVSSSSVSSDSSGGTTSYEVYGIITLTYDDTIVPTPSLVFSGQVTGGGCSLVDEPMDASCGLEYTENIITNSYEAIIQNPIDYTTGGEYTFTWAALGINLYSSRSSGLAITNTGTTDLSVEITGDIVLSHIVYPSEVYEPLSSYENEYATGYAEVSIIINITPI